MPWFIEDADGHRKEGFRTKTEAMHYLPEYGEGFHVTFEPTTKLQGLRMQAGLSQTELAFMAEIPLKTLQSLETGARNINGARTEISVRLAKILRCRVEDLLE